MAAVLGLAAAAGMSGAACRPSALVRDQGLHRAWRVDQDCAHPERPAILVEAPWTDAPGKAAIGKGASAHPSPVRDGMRVTVEEQRPQGWIHLSGTALGNAQVGERVGVRAGLGGAVLEGVVRGPGLIELLPRKGGS
ncbi:MAG TPA: hypothetical protein VL990_03935 [Acidobacteriaceae bacterium]|nr:hypothetical protein [Acidobacteriaceae bacterium]